LGLVVVAVVVGFLVDGRVRGPGDRALAEDAARGMASDGIQTHLFELVPTPTRSPRILHSIRGSHGWLRHDADVQRTEPAAWLDAEPGEACLAALAEQLSATVQRQTIGTLHAVGLGLAGRVARLVQARLGTPYCVTPRAADVAVGDAVEAAYRRDVLRGAQHVVLFDESVRTAMEAAFPVRAGESPLRWRILRRGVDLELFKPVPRPERGSAAVELGTRPELATRLAGLDWKRACVVLCLQHAGETEGFGQFLFAMPELLRQQAMLQAIVVSIGDVPPAVDRLRAALAAARPEALQGILQESELYQPLLDHLERLHLEGRTEAWWRHAARIEPERRVRYVGEVTREEFARLVAVSDLVVVPGVRPRPASHVPVEALAAGVPVVASAHAGMSGLSQLVAEGISAEIASLCVLRDDMPAVSELEEKLGRFVRLRPELGERLRALAVRKFDGRQTAADLRRLYGEPARTAARA
jgi:glycosyltransferase involved in cell wall biosynthesis